MNKTVVNEIKSALFGEKYDIIHHESGLDIYLFPKKTATSYALFATHYGSVDNAFKLGGEDEYTTVPDGIAHFLEHKMFACEDGSDAFDHFSLYGADANAYTSYDKTVYLFSCTSDFRPCLCELIDFVTHPYFTEENVAKEQGIIAEEIGMYDDSPSSRSYYAMLEGLYHNHDIKTNVCGTVDSIESITPEMLYRCHKVFYNYSNMALVICGDVTREEVISIADAHLPKQERIEIVRKTADEPRYAAREKSTSYMQLAKPIFDIGIKDTDIPETAERRARRDVIMSVIADLLFSKTGRLYNALYESGLISPSVSSGYTISKDFGYTSFSGESDDPDAVCDTVREYIEEKKKEGLGREEFERCRKVFYASFVRELDSPDDVANNLVSFVFDGYDFFGYADIIADVTYEEVMEAFLESYRSECFTVSRVFPIKDKKKG